MTSSAQWSLVTSVDVCMQELTPTWNVARLTEGTGSMCFAQSFKSCTVIPDTQIFWGESRGDGRDLLKSIDFTVESPSKRNVVLAPTAKARSFSGGE